MLKNLKKKTEKFLHERIPSERLAKQLSSIILHNISESDPSMGSPQSPPFYTFEVAKALKLPDETAEHLTLCSILFYSTADYADDFADGDLEGEPGIVLNHICLLLFLHQQCILSLPQVQDSQKQALIAFFSKEGIQMALGQQEDLQGKKNIDPLEVARKKAGAEAALFFGAPAVLTGQTPKPWISFGIAFGTLIQILSDYLDLFLNPDCEDWVDGKITLPLLQGFKHPRHGPILHALWQGNRSSPENQAQALWHLCQARVEKELKEVSDQELQQMRSACVELKNPSFLLKLISKLEEEIKEVCESLEEFRSDQGTNPPLTDFMSLNA